MSFILEPGTWILLLTLGTVFAFRKPTQVTLLAVVCYSLGHVFSSAYKLVSDGIPGANPTELLFWQGGIFATLVVYCLAGHRIGARVLWLPLFGGLFLASQWIGVDRYWAEVGLMTLISASVIATFFAIPKTDTLGMIAWGAVDAVEETWSVVEKAVCPILPQIYPTEPSTCARAFGPIAPTLDTLITAAILIWIGVRWTALRTR